METARISEIFVSYQGEGTWAGSRQLFVRFYGCKRSCVYCDTTPDSYKTFTKHSLMGKVLNFEDNYNELVLTGGEPLEYADFIKDFLDLYKTHRRNSVYLETDGTLPDGLMKVIDYIDIVAMDFKLPSSTLDYHDQSKIWEKHRRFAEIAKDKKLVIKAVVTDKTNIDDIKNMSHIIRGIDAEFDIIFQPVWPIDDTMKAPDDEMLSYFTKYAEKITGKKVMILGQLHKYLGIP